ncbi:MAG: aminotransferase class III-fold pyridoxal phosphate-dependent enzyme, partial [Dokdonella sp.]
GSTFGGNPLAAAVARVALRKLSAPALLEHVGAQGLHLQLGLERLGNSLGIFSQVRGRGLMLGAVLAPAYTGRAPEILDLAANEGLLLLQAGADVLRFVPALNIPTDDIDDGLARLERALVGMI